MKTLDILRQKDWLTHYPAPVHPAYLAPHTTVIEQPGCCPTSHTPHHSSHKLLSHCCTSRSSAGCYECTRESTVYLLPPVKTARGRNPMTKHLLKS